MAVIAIYFRKERCGYVVESPEFMRLSAILSSSFAKPGDTTFACVVSVKIDAAHQAAQTLRASTARGLPRN